MSVNNVRIKMFMKMCQMRVVAQDGTEYMPVWGYDGKICAYTLRDDALKTLPNFNDTEKSELELIT